MKSLLVIMLSILSSSAFAVEVGSKVIISRDAITCKDLGPKRPPRPNCPYCYILDDVESANVLVKADIAGVKEFTGVTTTCSDLDYKLGIGATATAEVVSIQDRKLNDSIIQRIIQISLAGVELVGVTQL